MYDCRLREIAECRLKRVKNVCLSVFREHCCSLKFLDCPIFMKCCVFFVFWLRQVLLSLKGYLWKLDLWMYNVRPSKVTFMKGKPLEGILSETTGLSRVEHPCQIEGHRSCNHAKSKLKSFSLLLTVQRKGHSKCTAYF